MAEGGEECELQQLVPPDDDAKHFTKLGEVTPPISPGIAKIAQTSPTSPSSNKISRASIGTGSMRGISSHGSITSRNATRGTTIPTLVTSGVVSPTGGSSTSGGAGGQNTKLLYVNEKTSRTSSLAPDNGTRPTREPRINPVAARLHNTKRVALARRNLQHHTFLSDITDVRRMEAGLLHLLEDFHSGKLQAFGKDCSMDQMTGIREQQERLARLHFDLGARQELYAPLSEEGIRVGQENMHRLVESLEQLSVSIEKLHSFSNDSLLQE